MEGVASASVDFVSKTLAMTIVDATAADDIMAKADEIIKHHDPGIVMNEKEQALPGTKVIYLDGLNCPDCAGKIERETKKIAGVLSSGIDLMAQKLTLEVENRNQLPVVLREALI